MKKALVRIPAPRLAPARFPLPARLVSGLALLGLLGGIGLFASRPAHSVGGPVAVTVANAPLATTASDNPAKQPVQVQLVLSQSGTFETFYTVPAGKRLVIEYVNCFSNVSNDPDKYDFALDTGDLITGFGVVPDGTPYASKSQKTLLYAEPGVPVTGFFQYYGSNTSPQIYVTLTGYLVNVS